MKKKIISALIIIGALAMSSPALAFAPNIQCGKEVSGCAIDSFSFDTGITPKCFQDPSLMATAIGWCDLLQIASNVIGFLYAIVIPIAILMITFGGLVMLTAGSNEKRQKQGKAFILSSLIGVAIALGAGLIISFIIRGLGVTDASLFPWIFPSK